MLHYDRSGLPLTTTSPAARDAFDRTVFGFLSHSKSTMDDLGAALAADPDLPMGRIAKGFFLLLLARHELTGEARAEMIHAKTTLEARGGDVREWRYLHALGELVRGRMRRAADTLDRLLDDQPRDILAVKLVHAIRFMLGDFAGMRRSIDKVAPAYADDAPFRGFVDGCMAFALEETGDRREAELHGRRAVATEPRDAWGRHAVAHVLEETGRIGDGIAWLEGRDDTWAHCHNFGDHMYWHLALFLLEAGRIDDVLALYDRKIRGSETNDYRDIANASSLLMRLELRGVNVADRWSELADNATTRIADGCLVFADLHYLLALFGAGRDDGARALQYQLCCRARRKATCQDGIVRDVGLATATALRAFNDGLYGEASDLLLGARSRLASIGGSHAQRDIFEQVMIEATIRAGRTAEAETLLAERIRARGGNNPFATEQMKRLRRAANDSDAGTLAALSAVAMPTAAH